MIISVIRKAVFCNWNNSEKFQLLQQVTIAPYDQSYFGIFPVFHLQIITKYCIFGPTKTRTFHNSCFSCYKQYDLLYFQRRIKIFEFLSLNIMFILFSKKVQQRTTNCVILVSIFSLKKTSENRKKHIKN